MAAAQAPRVSENPVIQDHYVAELGLTTALAQASSRIPDSPDFTKILAELTREFQAASISLAADYYTALRDQAGVSGSFNPPVIEPWSTDHLGAYLDAAMKDLATILEQKTQAVAIGQNLTANAAADEVFAAIGADPSKPRWARVTRPGACSFCLMLALRGAVYRTETSASFRAHMQINGSGGNCQCGVEPSFTKYEPAAHVRAARSLYAEATVGITGSKDKRNAFRRALYVQRNPSPLDAGTATAPGGQHDRNADRTHH